MLNKSVEQDNKAYSMHLQLPEFYTEHKKDMWKKQNKRQLENLR